MTKAQEFGRLAHLRESCKRAGLGLATYSPGDGVTRYRFFLPDEEADYFAGSGVFTALGLKEAFAFVNGARAGRRAFQMELQA